MSPAGRSVLLILAALLMASCTASESRTPPASGESSGQSVPSVPSVQPAPSLAAVAPWSPGPGEVRPEIKRAATEYLEAAGTWVGGAGDPAAVKSRLRAAGFGPAARAAGVVLAADAPQARLRVIYPQYGGLTGTLASVMVIVEQTLLDHGGGTTTQSLVLDVRLTLANGSPVVTGIAELSAKDRGEREPASSTARAVLQDPNIVLSGTGRQDVAEGRVENSVLRILRTLAASHELDVTVLRTGHPRNVFETDRISNHTRGRAVDIWRIDGEPVADPTTPRALLREVMVQAARSGATEVGGPFDLNGVRPGFFTDRVHQDHVHIGITPGRRPARP